MGMNKQAKDTPKTSSTMLHKVSNEQGTGKLQEQSVMNPVRILLLLMYVYLVKYLRLQTMYHSCGRLLLCFIIMVLLRFLCSFLFFQLTRAQVDILVNKMVKNHSKEVHQYRSSEKRELIIYYLAGLV